MFKNVASQKAWFFAYDSATNLPKAGDAANITAYVSKDYGTVTVLADTSATEADATNAKGWYLFDLAQAETNADTLLLSAKSSTSGIVVLGGLIYTVPVRFTTLAIDAAGLADANAVKIGPSGSGTAQTARDIGANVLISPGTGTGQLDVTTGAIRIKSNIRSGVALAAVEFLMVDTTDVPQTGKTVTVTRSIDGGTFASGTLSAVTEVGSGIYSVDLASGDMTGKIITLKAVATGCKTAFVQIVTDA